MHVAMDKHQGANAAWSTHSVAFFDDVWTTVFSASWAFGHRFPFLVACLGRVLRFRLRKENNTIPSKYGLQVSLFLCHQFCLWKPTKEASLATFFQYSLVGKEGLRKYLKDDSKIWQLPSNWKCSSGNPLVNSSGSESPANFNKPPPPFFVLVSWP